MAQFLLRILLGDFLIPLAAMEKCQGDFLRVGRSEDQRQKASRNVLSLVGQRVQIGQRQLARLHLPFDLGNLIFAQNRLEGIPGDDR